MSALRVLNEGFQYPFDKGDLLCKEIVEFSFLMSKLIDGTLEYYRYCYY